METVSRPISLHQAHELILKLEAVGLNTQLAQKIIQSPNNYLATKMMRLVQEIIINPVYNDDAYLSELQQLWESRNRNIQKK